MNLLYVLYGASVVVVAYLALPLVSWLITIVKVGMLQITRARGASMEKRAEASQPLLFLVPAHNEEKVIARCVRSLLNQDYPSEMLSIVVVADNCHDRTKDVVKDLDARCLERQEPERPGKPQAIEWALRQLGDLGQWEACVIIDADSEVAPDFARNLSVGGPLSRLHVQTYYTLLNPYASWLTRLGVVLIRAKYEVDYPLKRAAGLNCPLTGNGMSLGTRILARDGWNEFSLTENWELYARYTAKGVTIGLANGARIYSLEPPSMSQSWTRRSRWSRGRAQVFRDYWRTICRSTEIGWHQKLDALAELASPPPVVHAAVAATMSVSFIGVIGGDIGWWLGSAALLTLLPLTTETAISLWKDPQPLRAITAFLALPLYALWRVSLIFVVLLSREPAVWKKTDRG